MVLQMICVLYMIKIQYYNNTLFRRLAMSPSSGKEGDEIYIQLANKVTDIKTTQMCVCVCVCVCKYARPRILC
jgi:hypothetical protein